MFFILKLMLIILLNKTYAHITQDIQTILLPAWNPTNAKEIQLILKVFGKLIQLNLRRNDRIISPAFEIWNHNAKGVTEKLLLKALDFCFYYHKDHISSAAINFCDKHGLDGLVLLENDILEIRPSRNDFTLLSFIDDLCIREQVNVSFGKPHLIKRSLQYFADSELYHLNKFKPKRDVRNVQQKLTIELAVFFDKPAYDTFMPLLDNSIEKLRNMIIAYVNRIQAVYHHPSLGVPIDISLIRLDIEEKEKYSRRIDGSGHDYFWLPSFCTGMNRGNPPDDNDPHHWDISLYLTGLDLFELSDPHVPNYSSVGLAYFNGTCNPPRSCAIVEFDGTTRGRLDWPYPRQKLYPTKLSSNFASYLYAAREIGYLLGIGDDSNVTDSTCTEKKHIMAAQHTFRQIYQGKITWSKCSRDIAERLWETKQCLRDNTRSENLKHIYALNHLRYHDLPGRQWTAKAQCELFMRDKEANVVSLLDICQILQCETLHKNEFAGSALDGTHCARGKECRGGKCVPILEPPYKFKYCERDKWSEWKEGSCTSDCLSKSKGAIARRRFCKHRTRRTANCEGPYYDVAVCDDSKLCSRRKSINKYTREKCNNFREALSKIIRLDFNQIGLQKYHNVNKPWIACIIFCLQTIRNYNQFGFVNLTINWLAPRAELTNMNIDPYFPDGTWCHNKNGQDYYCHNDNPVYHTERDLLVGTHVRFNNIKN